MFERACRARVREVRGENWWRKTMRIDACVEAVTIFTTCHNIFAAIHHRSPPMFVAKTPIPARADRAVCARKMCCRQQHMRAVVIILMRDVYGDDMIQVDAAPRGRECPITERACRACAIYRH